MRWRRVLGVEVVLPVADRAAHLIHFRVVAYKPQSEVVGRCVQRLKAQPPTVSVVDGIVLLHIVTNDVDGAVAVHIEAGHSNGEYIVNHGK